MGRRARSGAGAGAPVGGARARAAKLCSQVLRVGAADPVSDTVYYLNTRDGSLHRYHPNVKPVIQYAQKVRRYAMAIRHPLGLTLRKM
eukprot:327923-Prorocentrum_minimum.AAC.2